MLPQQVSHPIRQPLHPFVALESRSTPDVHLMLSHLGLVALDPILRQVAADGAVMATEHRCDLSLAFAGLTKGRDLVSLFLGQLPVLPPHCFTLVGKAPEGTVDDPPASIRLGQSAAVII